MVPLAIRASGGITGTIAGATDAAETVDEAVIVIATEGSNRIQARTAARIVIATGSEIRSASKRPRRSSFRPVPCRPA
jgi:N-acetylmuramic acid 6-phosphate (MurNAc-6-P) etherase